MSRCSPVWVVATFFFPLRSRTCLSLLSDQGPVSRVSQRVAVWDKLLAGAGYDPIRQQEIIEILSHGATLGIPAESRCVRRRKVANSRTAIELASVVDASVKRDVELRRMICLGRTLPSEWLYPFVSPVAVIPKPRSSKWRFINHLSHGGVRSVNHRIPREMARVQYLSLPGIARELLARGPGTFLFTFDIEEAFRHIPMRREDWPCLVFQWRGNYYVDTKLGFGSASGPKNWDRIGQGLSAIMLHHGVPLLRMVDDHMGFGETWDTALERRGTRLVCRSCERTACWPTWVFHGQSTRMWVPRKRLISMGCGGRRSP